MDRPGRRAAQAAFERFIISGGMELPDWIREFKIGETLENLCPFCTDEHDGIGLETLVPITKAALKGLFLDDGCANKLLESNAFASNNLAKVERFISDLEFPFKTSAFLIHRTKIDDSDRAYFSGHCVLCSTLCLSRGVQVPVPFGLNPSHIDGGLVFLCSSCNQLLRKLNNSWSKVLKDAGCMYDRCPRCNEDYWITESEAEFRSATTHFGKHLCPECTYRNLNSTTHSFGNTRWQSVHVLRYDADNCSIIRHSAVSCETCNDTLTVDLTLTPETILSEFISVEGKVTCEYCFQDEHSPLVLAKVGGKFFRVYKNGDKYDLKISDHIERLLGNHKELGGEEVLRIIESGNNY
jgi:hypothetical protein